MRVLMVSPHPTYSPRGTPISVLNRCKALSALDHQVDLVTYGIGEDVPVPGLRYLRAPVPGITTVKVGPSAKKVPLDLAVFAKAWRTLRGASTPYDVLHTHEEAGSLGARLARKRGLPHVYDMGNDLAVVLTNYGFSEGHPATRTAARLEAYTIRGAQSVIAHFPSLAAHLAEVSPATPAVVVHNVPVEGPADPSTVARYRAAWSHDGMPVVLYTGTLEDYQGLPAMVEAMGLAAAGGARARLVIAGGRPEQQEVLADLVRKRGLTDLVLIAGLLPPADMPSCLQAADILTSPRGSGTNTPLKVFSYLHSGRPVLATRIESHSQVMDDSVCELVEPTARGLADGLARLLGDVDRRTDLAAAGQALAEKSFGVVGYLRGVAEAYAHVGAPMPSEAELRAAAVRLAGRPVALAS